MDQTTLEEEKQIVKIEKLRKDFSLHCGKDVSKRCILYSKYILQGLNVWPDNKEFAKRWIVILSVVSLGIMECAHILYVLMHITDISKVTSACTTVSTTLETMAKLVTMLVFRDPLNKILCIIWKDFWPSNMTSQRCQKDIKLRTNYVLMVSSTFLLMAYVSCAQFMAFPLIANTKQLPLSSWYPFDFTATPIYQLMYIWQWFMNQIVIVTLSGFDAFFNSIVMICATQFIVLQDVLENVFTENGKLHKEIIFRRRGRGEREIRPTDVLVKCVQHHLKLIEICELIKVTFQHIVFIQFVASTLAICVSCVALIADPSLFEHMFSYAVAHLLQFFIYCSVGNELTHQSGNVADSAYNCDWEVNQDKDLEIMLIMIIQRAHRPQALTVGGLMQLSYSNFLATVQLSFSFYTLLTSLV